MWIIYSDGDAFGDKKLWLPPGKKFIFGRTKPEGDGFAVADKTVSRQHMTVEVVGGDAAACKNARTRSKVLIQDLGTKIGTYVNGQQIRISPGADGVIPKSEEVLLERERNEVRMGRYKYSFFITWVPVALTFSFTSKEHKANPWDQLYADLGPLDIKVLMDYERGVTSHVVAKKRNTAKGLQALIDGKFIVYNDSFVRALVDAAASGALQDDFEAGMPNPLEYLPPKGDEPTQRPELAYAPEIDRQNMFEGYTFVFYHRSQYDNLMAPITAGHGKAELMEVVPEETTVEDFARFVKKLAHEEGTGSFEEATGKGVVVVRYNAPKDPGGWYRDFTRDVALQLDHRLIEQNEFLDAILGTDASVLRRSLEVEQSGIFAPPPSAASRANLASSQIRPETQAQAAPTQASEMAPPSPPIRARGRRGARPKFTGFDDDDFSAPTPAIRSSIAESMDVDPPASIDSQPSQGLFVSQVSEDAPEPSQHPIKRKAPPVMEEEEIDVMGHLATNSLRYKRQKLAEAEERRRRGEATPPKPVSVAPPKPAPAPAGTVPKKPIPRPKSRKVPEPEKDIFSAIQVAREAAAEKEEKEEGNIQEQISNLTIEVMKERVAIAEMRVLEGRNNPRAERGARADESERWDERWNGRKNFKQFRRVPGAPRAGGEKVIVLLEEAKKRDYGLGEEYWGHEKTADSQARLKSRKEKGKERERESQSYREDNSLMDTHSDPKVKTRKPIQTKAQSKPAPKSTSKAAQILQGQLSDSDSDNIDPFPNPDPVLNASSDVEIVDPPPAISTTTRKRKEQPSPTASKKSTAEPASKKLKVLGIRRGREREESESSEDEMKFRLKKRK